MELRKFLDAAYKTDLARGKKVTATNVRGNAKTFAAQNLTDGSDKSYWATDDKVTTASLTIDSGKGYRAEPDCAHGKHPARPACEIFLRRILGRGSI